jgi:hypothetical protein
VAQRYKGIKGKFWTVFAQYIRRRDFLKYGTCITCGEPKTYEELQAGHYAPAGNCGFALLFDECNVHGECAYDNGFNSGHLIQYRAGLVRRYGAKRVGDIERRYNDSRYKGKTTKEWSKKEYEAKTEEYKLKLKLLEGAHDFANRFEGVMKSL